MELEDFVSDELVKISLDDEKSIVSEDDGEDSRELDEFSVKELEDSTS